MNRLVNMSVIIIFIIILDAIAFAQDNYSPVIVYTIPWGNKLGKISSDFKTITYVGDSEIFEPGPWAVSESGTLIIIDATSDESHIMTFDINGSLLACRNIYNSGLIIPNEIAILNSGEIAIHNWQRSGYIQLLDSDLDILHEIFLPYSGSHFVLFNVTPTNYGSFWLAYMVIAKDNNIEYKNYYKIEIFLDGSFSTPEITWDDASNTGIPARYISPDGIPFITQADEYGAYYTETYITNEGYKLNKWQLVDPNTVYEVVYSHTSCSDSGWEIFESAQNNHQKHFVTWCGDFYTIHATDAGLVLTKYTYVPE